MNDKQHSDAPDITTAAPDQTAANAEPQHPAEIESPAPTTAAADDPNSGGDSKGKREQPRPRSKPNKRAHRAAGESGDHSGAASAGKLRSLAERLLAPLELPRVTLDRKLLPPKLFAALDAADDEPVPDTARSGRANAIISPSCWYKNSVRPVAYLRTSPTLLPCWSLR